VTGPSRGPADGIGPAPVDIGFRRLTEADLPLVYAWRRRDFVAEWYGNPPASLGVRRAKAAFVADGTRRFWHLGCRAVAQTPSGADLGLMTLCEVSQPGDAV